MYVCMCTIIIITIIIISSSSMIVYTSIVYSAWGVRLDRALPAEAPEGPGRV